MAENAFIYIWRCAKCSSHFVNITKNQGILKQEKKCSKCKSLNILTLTDKEIFIHCKCYNPDTNGYSNEFQENIPYPV